MRAAGNFTYEITFYLASLRTREICSNISGKTLWTRPCLTHPLSLHVLKINLNLLCPVYAFLQASLGCHCIPVPRDIQQICRNTSKTDSYPALLKRALLSLVSIGINKGLHQEGGLRRGRLCTWRGSAWPCLAVQEALILAPPCTHADF